MNLPPTSGITKFSARLETLQQFYHFSPNLPCSIVSLSFSFSRFFAVPFSSLFLLFRFSCSISFARSSNRKRSRKKGRKEGRDRVIQQWAGAPRNCFTREKQGRNKKVSREADGRWRREVRACQCFLFSSRYLQSKIKRTRCFFPLPTFFFLLFSFLFFVYVSVAFLFSGHSMLSLSLSFSRCSRPLTFSWFFSPRFCVSGRTSPTNSRYETRQHFPAAERNRERWLSTLKTRVVSLDIAPSDDVIIVPRKVSLFSNGYTCIRGKWTWNAVTKFLVQRLEQLFWNTFLESTVVIFYILVPCE